jgi:hypothetical protein
LAEEAVRDLARTLLEFHFDGKTLRAGLTEYRKPYVVAADVGEIVGHPDLSRVLSRLDPDEKVVVGIGSPDDPGASAA